MTVTGPVEPVQFGRYRLEKRLAVGGMAEIFRAKSYGLHGFEKTLAIKRILPNLNADKEFVQMFIDEARVMTQLSHPKIVQVHDFGEVEGQYYIAMEYVEGLDLLELLRTCAKRKVRPTTAVAVHVIAEVLDALDFAHTLCAADGHNLGIVHADVSPSNIFVSWQGEVKLGDFGIARALGGRGQNESGALRGKYGYMSPEQVSGRRPVDGRADIFASGIVLAELLMIRRLFIAKNDLEVLLRVRDARLDRLYKYGKRIPSDLLCVLESALARDPDLRYQSAASFRDALHRYLFENRRMVRSADVRRFLGRLTDSSKPVSAEPEALDVSRAVQRPGDRDSFALPLGVDPPPMVPLGPDETTPPIIVMPTVEAPREMQAKLIEEARPPAGLVASGAPVPWLTRAPSLDVLAGGQAVVGRKRRIQLSPPPIPPPVPQGLPQTGEEPRLTTHQALAAVPELGASGSSSNADFRSSGQPDEDAKPVLSEVAAPIESEIAAASRQTTPIEGVPTMAAPDRKGHLDSHSLFKVLFRLAMDEDTGLLVLRREDLVKEIYLVDGHPHYVSSNQAEELFGQYLVKKGVLSSGELSMALAMLPHFSGRLGDTLVALKLMRPMQVLRHLTHQVRQKLLEAFSWSAGVFMFYRDKQCAHESAPLGLDAYELLGAGIDLVPYRVVQTALAPHLSRKLTTTMPPLVPPEVFRLGALPRRTHDKLNGERTLSELLHRFDDPGQKEAFERVVYLLLETRLAS